MSRHGTARLAPRVTPRLISGAAILWSLLILSVLGAGIQAKEITAHHPLSLHEIQNKPRIQQVELDPAGTKIAFLQRE